MPQNFNDVSDDVREAVNTTRLYAHMMWDLNGANIDGDTVDEAFHQESTLDPDEYEQYLSLVEQQNKDDDPFTLERDSDNHVVYRIRRKPGFWAKLRRR